MDRAIKVSDKMIRKGCSPYVVNYNILIYGYCKDKRIDKAMRLIKLELLHEMQGCGKHPNVQTYAILLDGLCKNLHFPKAMALFQEDKKLDLNIVIYNILIDNTCHVRKLTTAREFFNSLPIKGFQADVWTYTIMIKGLSKDGLLNEVRELFEKMEENGSSPMRHHGQCNAISPNDG
jgi:pentatricopeptide repeat protein